MPEKTVPFAEEILERSRKDSRLAPEEFGKDAYDMYCVPLDLYHKHKEEILRLSLACSKWVAPADGSVVLEKVDQLSDAEIADRLGLDRDTVRKIRCMAEWDLPMEVWRNAAEFKRRRRLELKLGCPDRDIPDEPG